MTLDELGTGLAAAISTVLVNRLMIAVRRHYYIRELVRVHTEPTRGENWRSEPMVLTTIVFDESATLVGTTRPRDEGVSRECEGPDEFEMQDFSERAGF